MLSLVLVVAIGLAALAAWDVTQRQHAILHNFPLVGTCATSSRPSGPSCASTSLPRTTTIALSPAISASAKQENTDFGFGTDNDPEVANSYLIIKHAAFAHLGDELRLALVQRRAGDQPRCHLGGGRCRTQAMAAPAHTTTTAAAGSGRSARATSGVATHTVALTLGC